MRHLMIAAALLCLGSGLSGCAVAGAAVDVGATAVSTTVDVAGDVVSTAADVATGSDKKKKSDDDSDDKDH